MHRLSITCLILSGFSHAIANDYPLYVADSIESTALTEPSGSSQYKTDLTPPHQITIGGDFLY